VPDRRHELERIIREQLIPALREEEGFCGALHLAGRDGEGTMMIVCWETEQQATRPYSDYRESSLAAVAAIGAISSEFHGRFSVWEIDVRA
jgi:hypothetical protein